MTAVRIPHNVKSCIIVATGLGLFLVLAFGCSGDIGVEREKNELRQADLDFSKLSIENGTYEAFDSFMAENATIYVDKIHPITGRDAIRRHFSKSAGGTLEWETGFVDISSSGDLGYTLGSYKHTVIDSAGIGRIGTGYYVTIWKKQPDGGWKYVFDTGIESP